MGPASNCVRSQNKAGILEVTGLLSAAEPKSTLPPFSWSSLVTKTKSKKFCRVIPKFSLFSARNLKIDAPPNVVISSKKDTRHVGAGRGATSRASRVLMSSRTKTIPIGLPVSLLHVQQVLERTLTTKKTRSQSDKNFLKNFRKI